MSLPSSPVLTDCSFSSARIDSSMPGEASSPVGPRHIGQIDETRELLDTIDQVHSAG